MAKLGGIVFCIDAIKYDYNIAQCIECLQELCDEVIVFDAGSDDGTQHLLSQFSNKKTRVFAWPRDEWNSINGSNKLAHFQNKALEYLSTDWYYLQQADECTTEKSFPYIRKAIESDTADAYMISRINLWRSPYTYLDVPHNRKPCSSEIIRLAKTEYKSVGDGESIGAQCSLEYVNDIRMYHFGFVRKREVMKDKIINMQEQIFQTTRDAKLDQCEVFNPDLWFDPQKDLQLINEPLPKYMHKWAAERVY